MYIEQKIEALEKIVKELQEKVSIYEAKGEERFVTPTELAEMMNCAPNTVYTKIRSGEIYATRKAGDPRIPMSQFYNSDPIDLIKHKPEKLRKVSGGESMKELIFGKG